METIVTPDKSYYRFDIYTDLIFTGYGGTKVSKLVYNVESTTVSRNRRFDGAHVSICQQHIFDFDLITRQAHNSKLIFTCTKSNSIIRAQAARHLRYTADFRRALTITKLIRSGDKGSPCFEPCTVSKGSKKFVSCLHKANALAQRVICIAGIPSLYNVANM